MARFAALTPLLLCLVAPSHALCGPAANALEVNGVRLQYVEQGSGDPIVFVHGFLGDLRTWEPVRGEIAKRDKTGGKYRYIFLTQRYFGTGPWPDEGQMFSAATHADDLGKFVSALNVGPVHLVGWSYGGTVVATLALNNPSLVRSAVLYEANATSLLPPDSPEGSAAQEDRSKSVGPAIAAITAGDSARAARLFIEDVLQLPPGGFGGLPQAVQARVLENARTLPPALAAPPPAITCDVLNKWTHPTLVMRGEKTHRHYKLISERIGKCVPGAQEFVLPNANHGGPGRDPATFADAVLDFISKH